MRTSVFLATVLLVALVLVAENPFPSLPVQNEQTGAQVSGAPANKAAAPQHNPSGDGVRMWRRAEVQVVPLDVAIGNRAELEALRERVARAENDTAMVNASDPAVREQLQKQLQLIRWLLSYAERTQSDRGKSPRAMEVQRHLNDIEGRVNCEACHTGVVAERSK